MKIKSNQTTASNHVLFFFIAYVLCNQITVKSLSLLNLMGRFSIWGAFHKLCKLPEWEKKDQCTLCASVAGVSLPYGSIHACSFTVQYRYISGVAMEALNWISTHVRLSSEWGAAGSGPAFHPLLIHRAGRNVPRSTLISEVQSRLQWNEERSFATI